MPRAKKKTPKRHRRYVVLDVGVLHEELKEEAKARDMNLTSYVKSLLYVARHKIPPPERKTA